MMKKYLPLLLITLFLVGCVQPPQIADPVSFYYIPAEDLEEEDFAAEVSYIRADVRDKAQLGDSLNLILSAYLRDPASTSGLKSPFPAHTYLFSVSQDNNVASVVLSTEFAQLQNMDLTIACACLARTCMELTGADTVLISAENAQLDGAEYIRMDMRTVLLFDEYRMESE